MRHSKRILSLFMVVIMTFSVCFALTMTASARDDICVKFNQPLTLQR